MTTLQVGAREVPRRLETVESVRKRPWRLLMGSSDTTNGMDFIEVGRRVTVRTRYLGSWAGGFEVAKLLDEGYLLRRVSDGTVLPDVIAFSDVRRDLAGF